MNRNTILTAGAGLAAAALLGFGGAAVASADTGSGTTSGSTGTTQSQQALPANADPSKPVRSDEKLLTGDTAAKVTAAAKAKEPTATIERVETDSEGVYEAHMVRTDGTHIIVQVGKDFAVTNVQVMGTPGGPNGQAPQWQNGQPGQSGQGTAPSTTPSSNA